MCSVMYFIVHAAFVRIKLMMMMIVGRQCRAVWCGPIISNCEYFALCLDTKTHITTSLLRDVTHNDSRR